MFHVGLRGYKASKSGFPLSRNFHVRTHVNFTRVNKIEVMYDRPRVNVKVERGSTFAFTRDLPYIAFTSFTRVKFTYVSTLKLRNSGNQRLGFDCFPN